MKNDLYRYQQSENLSEDKIAFRNIKSILANIKRLEYQMSIVESLLRSTLEELKEIRTQRNKQGI